MTARQIYYPLVGGLDQETPPIAIPPGRAIGVSNYESVSRGYARVQGYETFDGHPRPSDATYSLIEFIAGVTAFVTGQTVTGGTSGATARVLATPVLTSGAWNGSGAGILAVHLIVGTFLDGEALRVGGVTKATIDVPPVEGVGYEDAANAAYLLAAQTYARSLIAKPAGTGAVRGLLWYGGKLNVWRDNGGAGVLHTSSATGWTTPDLGRILHYDSGSNAIAPGATITGATSSATGVVRSITVNAGTDWTSADAAGTMVLDSVTGTFIDNEDINITGHANAASVNGVVTVAAFPAGGRYEFVIHNFYGSTGYERAYGANGVGPAFAFDGASIIPINTGMPDDRPFLIQAHKNHLFLGFPKGSLQHSDDGEPLSFTAILGAAELGMGSELTALVPNAGDTLLIATDKSLTTLIGNDSSDWVLEAVSIEASGAKAHTVQRIGQIIYLDQRGVRSLSATQAYGNFRLGSYTSLVQKELDAKRRRSAEAIASCVVKSKDQYLLFFDDGTGISIYFGRKQPEAMLFQYPFVVSCIHVAEVGSEERVWVGTTDGDVFELNRGTSFNGDVIPAFLQLPFGHQGGPRVLKRYQKAVIELTAGPRTLLSVAAEFDYGSGYQIYQHSDIYGNTQTFLHSDVMGAEGAGGLWDIASYAQFQWDSPLVTQAETYIQGMGTNMSLILFSASATQESDVLSGITLLFSPRGQKR